MRPVRLAAAWFPLFAVALPANAQTIDPIGRIDPRALPLAQVAVIDLPPLDRPAIAAEDERRRTAGLPAQFAIPHVMSVSTDLTGTWEVLDATWSLWRLRVRSPDASHLNLGLTTCRLPGAARLMVYAADYSHIVRPFAARDCGPEGQLWLPVVPGRELVLEVYLPTAQRGQLAVTLGQAGSGYRFFGAGPTAVAQGLPEQGSCNLDVTCPQAAPWVAQIPGVGAMSIAGSRFCTGALLNNTSQDGRALFLTADHCGLSGNAPSLVVYWNYEHAYCGDTSINLGDFSTGATVRAAWPATDFALLELNQVPDPAFGVTWLGWDRVCEHTPTAASIHCGLGDAKRIATTNAPLTVSSWGGTTSPGDRTHLRLSWSTGATAPGASGSPLLCHNGRVIGQLHGGNSMCNLPGQDWYGRFSESWNGGGSATTRLSDWLDPTGTGAIYTETWSPAIYRPFGPGCDGSIAPPELTAASAPRSGQPLQLTLHHLPVDVAMLFTGLSRTTSTLGPLPLPLDPLGMPGCVARVGPEASVLVAGTNNLAHHTMLIPIGVPLHGTRFFQQGLVLDPGFNAAGLTMSEATVAVIDGLPGGFGGFPPEMVPIPAGSFLMGSNATTGHPYYSQDWERPVHQVSLTHAFWMSRYEITQAEYRSVMCENPSREQGPAYPDSDRRPVTWVTWQMAQRYCQALTAAQAAVGRLPSGYVYRLPTEAEWEYCCRAGSTTEYHTGQTIGCDQAAFDDNHFTGLGCGHRRTRPVGSYPPNAFGLHDMHGNVSEWCLDRWSGNLNYPAGSVVDPYVATGTFEVIRGGSYDDDSDVCRSAERDSSSGAVTYTRSDLGFRIVLAPPR